MSSNQRQENGNAHEESLRDSKCNQAIFCRTTSICFNMSTTRLQLGMLWDAKIPLAILRLFARVGRRNLFLMDVSTAAICRA
jgi:hypothetical protein